MRSLEDLLATPGGRGWLADRGVVTDVRDFVARLRAPADPVLAERCGASPGSPLVYVGQQLLPDQGPAVVAKLRLLRRLAVGTDIAPLLLWLDTDRAGSEPATMRVRIPGYPSVGRLARRRYRDREIRFVPTDRTQLDDAVGVLRHGLTAVLDRQRRRPALHRLDLLAQRLQDSSVTTLAACNLAITDVLVRDHLDLRAPARSVSELLGAGLLDGGVATALADPDRFRAVFDRAVRELRDAGIDPQVAERPDDRLPLHHSCADDLVRCQLFPSWEGDALVAAGTCPCGRTYRFPLGGPTRSVASLAATGRWSLDVTLPVFLAPLVSGVVAGRSSALYGLVLDRVLTDVLGGEPVPMLVPTPVGGAGALRSGSLLYDHLTDAP